MLSFLVTFRLSTLVLSNISCNVINTISIVLRAHLPEVKIQNESNLYGGALAC